MKATPEEQKTLGFVALLLVLSAAARFGAGGTGEATVTTDAPEVDVPALVREDSTLIARETRRHTPVAAGETIDLNAAGAAELQRLSGVGPATARAILALRDSLGGFRAPEDLLKAKGIGPTRLKRIAPQVRVGPIPRMRPRR